MIKLLYVDLFCGAGGTSTGVENARYEDEQCAKVICEMNFGPAQFSDILSLIQKGKAVSVYDLPYNPYINGKDKNL